MRESVAQAEILLAIGGRPDVRAFRNTVGEGWVGKAKRLDGGAVLIRNSRYVTFGLAPGSADLIGWHSVLVTPDMVGRRLARFAGWEVKSSDGESRDNQERFLAMLDSHGGIAGIVRSPEEALRTLTTR
jgi:hypothetical protein